MTGPLAGVRVLELAAIGPAPFGCMLLADQGAEVIRVDRPDGRIHESWHSILDRGRKSIALNLKHPHGREVLMRLVERSDVLVEGFRPGVAERLGIGPAECRQRNPGLVYARMTGWGQAGPLAQRAGHDINYIALSGVLHAVGVPPINLLGDFAAGGMFLATGVLAALVERQRSGTGQVVNASIVDGLASLMSMVHGMARAGEWVHEPCSNLLDGGAPFYAMYECRDGGKIAVGALEEPFYQQLVEGLGLTGLPDRWDKANWTVIRGAFQQRFATRTRDEWAAHFAGTDACVTPVLTVPEAMAHPHYQALGVYSDGEPAPAPRFSRSRPEDSQRAPRTGEHTRHVLAGCGLSTSEIDGLLSTGVARSVGNPADR